MIVSIVVSGAAPAVGAGKPGVRAEDPHVDVDDHVLVVRPGLSPDRIAVVRRVHRAPGCVERPDQIAAAVEQLDSARRRSSVMSPNSSASMLVSVSAPSSPSPALLSVTEVKPVTLPLAVGDVDDRIVGAVAGIDGGVGVAAAVQTVVAAIAAQQVVAAEAR